MTPSKPNQQLIAVVGALIAMAMLLFEIFHPSARQYFLAGCAAVLCGFFCLSEWSSRQRIAAAISAARERPIDVDD